MQYAREDRERRCFPNKAITSLSTIWSKYEITIRLFWKYYRVRECWFTFQVCVLNSKCSKGISTEISSSLWLYSFTKSLYMWDSFKIFRNFTTAQKWLSWWSVRLLWPPKNYDKWEGSVTVLLSSNVSVTSFKTAGLVATMRTPKPVRGLCLTHQISHHVIASFAQQYY